MTAYYNEHDENRKEPMTVGQSLAAVALWDTQRFDTCEIADVLKVTEAEVANVLHVVREERRKRA